ncbi:MAG: hypothetical protein KatS3mg071_1686 [Meiothermus sp.]|nr:MAG: hypothetical protein KatS3mg071_1686 [Meiothermus sp.]
MASIRDIAIEYGQQVERLLEQLGARGPARGAGELLDQVKHLLDEPELRRVRRFLRLRNKVVHGKPVEMPMPSWEQVDQAGREAVGVLTGVVARRRPAPQARDPLRDKQAPPRQPSLEPPGPVYRVREREGAHEVWVGPAGVWVVAQEPAALERARLDTEVRLVTRFPRLPVKAARRADGVEARIRWGRPRLSPEQIALAVRLLTQPPGADEPPSRPSAAPQGSAHRLRRVALEGIPATFYVGPVGVLAVAEHPLVAETEARRVREDSQGAIPAIPVVRAPGLKEPQGRVEGVLALRDEAAILDYLRGKPWLDETEVDQVAGWLYNRTAAPPVIQPKEGRYRLKGAEVAEGRTPAPPAFTVELVPPGPPPKPSPGQGAWRAVFLPELVMLLWLVLQRPGPESVWLLLLIGGLLLRFLALYGEPQGWKRWTLLGVGALELSLVWYALDGLKGLEPGRLLAEWHWTAILLPGLVSFFRGLWPFGVAASRYSRTLAR